MNKKIISALTMLVIFMYSIDAHGYTRQLISFGDLGCICSNGCYTEWDDYDLEHTAIFIESGISGSTICEDPMSGIKNDIDCAVDEINKYIDASISPLWNQSVPNDLDCDKSYSSIFTGSDALFTAYLRPNTDQAYTSACLGTPEPTCSPSGFGTINILQAHIMVRDTNIHGNMDPIATPKIYGVEGRFLKGTLVHELGHYLGLDHWGLNIDTMNAGLVPGSWYEANTSYNPTIKGFFAPGPEFQKALNNQYGASSGGNDVGVLMFAYVNSGTSPIQIVNHATRCPGDTVHISYTIQNRSSTSKSVIARHVISPTYFVNSGTLLEAMPITIGAYSSMLVSKYYTVPIGLTNNKNYYTGVYLKNSSGGLLVDQYSSNNRTPMTTNPFTYKSSCP